MVDISSGVRTMKVLQIIIALLCMIAIASADVVCNTDDSLSTAVASSNFFSVSTGTITAWYTGTSAGTTAGTCWQGRTIVGDVDKNFIIAHRFSGANQFCGYNFDGTSDLVVSGTITLDTAYHLTWVHTGGNILFYVNGASVGTTASGNTSSLTGALAICTAGSGGAGAIGVVSDVMTFSTALSAEEILARASSKTKGLSGTQPTGHWMLGECGEGAACNGVSFKDRSGGNRHITGDDGADNVGLTGKATVVLTYPLSVEGW